MSRSLSKRVRFEVFKRDVFTCQYCGRTPPDVVLECDHIEPKAEGGSDDEGNLITACFDCNRGKSAIPLTVVPESLAERAARVAEAEAQLAAYRETMSAQRERQESDVWDIIEILEGARETTHERFGSVQRFLGRLPYEEVVSAAHTTRQNTPSYLSVARRFKYFYAVCWGKIREAEDGEG